MLWIGPRLSALERLAMASFVANGHAVHLYTYEHVDGVPEGVDRLDAAEILPQSAVFTYADGFGKGSPSAFANRFRYKLLLERGVPPVAADAAHRPRGALLERGLALPRARQGRVVPERRRLRDAQAPLRPMMCR